MTKPPLSVTIVSLLFIAAGSVGLAYHAAEFKSASPLQYDLVWVCLVRLLAIVFGVFLLRGHNWARWGVLAWLAYHVVLSVFHSVTGAVIHVLLLAVIGFSLMRPAVARFFRGAAQGSDQAPPAMDQQAS